MRMWHKHVGEKKTEWKYTYMPEYLNGPHKGEAHRRYGEAIEAGAEKTRAQDTTTEIAAIWQLGGGGVGQVSLMPGRTAPRQGANQEDELVCRDSAVS